MVLWFGWAGDEIFPRHPDPTQGGGVGGTGEREREGDEGEGGGKEKGRWENTPGNLFSPSTPPFLARGLG